MSRITDDFTPGKNLPVKLCFCKDCTFAFYDYRMTDEEVNRYYTGYRSEEFQKQRQSYEYFYTEELNNAFNNSTRYVGEQQKVIERIISKNIHKEIRIALDYGGNEGKTFTDMLGTREKYVYDISHAPTVKGVESIAVYEELKNYEFDFVMCNMVFEHVTEPMKIMQNFREIGNANTVFYIEVPDENPFIKRHGRHSIMRNIRLLFNPYLHIWDLARYYFKIRKYPFMPMSEHINYFTPQSLRTMAEKSGFSVIDIQENSEWGPLEYTDVLSMLFRMQ